MSKSSLLEDTTDPCLKHNLKGHRKPITELAFHPDGKQLASSSQDNSILLWNLSSKSVRCYNFKGHSDIVTSVEFSSNGQLMATGSQDQTVRIWIPTIKGGSNDFRAHSAAVRTVCFMPDNRSIITGSNDKSIKMWDVHRRKFQSSFAGHTNWVRCVRPTPDGHVIVSCADDRTVRLWDVSSGQCIHTFINTKGSGNYLSIHHSGNSIAVAMSTGSVRVYDIRTHKLQQHYTLHNSTTGVSWHPNASYILTCGLDGTLHVVDALEGRPLYTLTGHEGPVHTVKFSHDGEYFASAGADCHVMAWKTNFVTNCKPSSSTTVSMSSSSVESA